MGPPLRHTSAGGLNCCCSQDLRLKRQAGHHICAGSMQRERQVCSVKATCGDVPKIKTSGEENEVDQSAQCAKEQVRCDTYELGYARRRLWNQPDTIK